MAEFWGGGRGGGGGREGEGEASGSYVGGGAGGKLRTSRSSRRAAATPYDRPQTGRHAPAAVRAAARGDSDSSSWVWRAVVDPASRLINNGAVKWFSTVFRKRALPPPAHEQEIQEERLQEVEEEPVENAVRTEVVNKEGEVNPVENNKNESEIAGLEQLLKNKTLSREEFNHLIGVLQSRVVDNFPGMVNHEENTREEIYGRNEPNNVQIAETQRWRDERTKASEVKDNPSWGNGLLPDVLSPSVTGNVFDDAGSTPADIAKAFMGVRSHRAPTSTLRLQCRPFGDESTPNRLFRDAHTQDRSNAYQLVPRTTENDPFGNGQVADRLKTPSNRLNSLQYPRSRNRVQGRNYTPYAGNFRQQAHSEHTGDGTPITISASQWTPIQSPLTGGRQMLKKRTGSVLDDGMTSGGPIRRIRQKTTFYTPLRNSDPSSSTSNQLNPFTLHSNDFGQKTVAAVATKPMEIEKHKFLSAFPLQEEGTKALTSNLGYVPQQSSETARKILEHLERMVPSPKEKSVETQLAIARSKPPSQLNVSMLNGHARRSTETVNKIAFLDMPEQSTFSLQGNNQSRGQAASDSEKIFEGNGKSFLSKSFEASVESHEFHDTGDVAFQHVDVSQAMVDMNSQALHSSPVPEKENGFRMSALEESDEECHVSKNDAVLVSSQTGNGTFISHGNSTEVTTLKGDKATPSINSSEAIAPPYAISATVEPSTKFSGFTCPVVSAASNFPEPPTPTVRPSPLFKGNTQPVTDNIAPTYNFGSTSTSKGPVFSFSTSVCTDVDTSKPEFDFKFESKPEEAFSTAVAAAVSTLPNQTSLGSSEPLASVSKVVLDPVFSGNLSSVSSTSSNLFTSSIAIAASGVKVSSGPIYKTDGNKDLSSVPSSSSNFSTATVGIPASGVKAFDGAVCKPDSNISVTFLPPATSSSVTFGSTIPPLFVSAGVTSVSSGSSSPFGLIASSSSSSGSLSSVGLSTNPFGVNTPAPAPLFSSSTAASETATTATFGVPRNPSLGSSSTSFGGSSVPSFGLSSTPQFGSNASVSFGLGTTSQSNTSPFFGSITTPQFGSNSSSLFGSNSSSQFVSNSSSSSVSSMIFDENTSSRFATGSSPSFGSGSAPIFNSGSTFGSGNLSFGGNTTSFSSSSTTALGASGASSTSTSTSPFGGSIASFGSSSLAASGGSSASFSSASTSPFGGSIASFGSSSLSASGGSSASFGSSSLQASGGSSSLFGSSSTPMFGSNNNPPFGVAPFFGASSAASSSQSSGTYFGSGFGSTPTMGSTGFSFGGSVAASSGSFPVGTSSGATPGTFSFGSKDTTTLAPQSIFGLTNSNPTFGATTATPPTDQMEDSMAEDLTQAPAPPVFGGQSASSTPGFMFSSQQSAPPNFMFNSQPSPQVVNPFAAGGQGTFTPPAGALEFSGGSFSLGATGEKPGRKFVKVKRDRGRKK